MQSLHPDNAVIGLRCASERASQRHHRSGCQLFEDNNCSATPAGAVQHVTWPAQDLIRALTLVLALVFLVLLPLLLLSVTVRPLAILLKRGLAHIVLPLPLLHPRQQAQSLGILVAAKL